MKTCRWLLASTLPNTTKCNTKSVATYIEIGRTISRLRCFVYISYFLMMGPFPAQCFQKYPSHSPIWVREKKAMSWRKAINIRRKNASQIGATTTTLETTSKASSVDVNSALSKDKTRGRFVGRKSQLQITGNDKFYKQPTKIGASNAEF